MSIRTKTTVKVKAACSVGVSSCKDESGHQIEEVVHKVTITIETDALEAAIFGDFMHIVKPGGEYSELPSLISNALYAANVYPDSCGMDELPRELRGLLDLDEMVLALPEPEVIK